MCTMLYTISTPRVYARLRHDINTAVDSSQASSPIIITSAEARKLPYLQAVVLEGIRMRPPIIYGHYRQAPRTGDVLKGGVRIPSGTGIGINHAAMMRNTDVFGLDVDVFRPERFLDCDAATRARREQTVHLAFGAGRWACAGKTIALIELDKIYFEVSFPQALFNYYLDCGVRPERDDAH
jgi:cytochrome P450